MPPTKIRLTRKQLYEEIWNISVAGVSKKYGIPYAKCLATIKAARSLFRPLDTGPNLTTENPWSRRPFPATGMQSLS